jgi:hypothetical protein
MGYAPVSDGLYSHHKVQLLGRDQDALTLWLLALTWSTQHTSDGKVPLLVTRTLCGRRANRWATALCRVGLWEEIEGGFQFHDFLDWQKSRQEIDEIRNKKRYAGSLGGKRSAQARATSTLQAPAKHVLNPLRSRSNERDSPTTFASRPSSRDADGNYIVRAVDTPPAAPPRLPEGQAPRPAGDASDEDDPNPPEPVAEVVGPLVDAMRLNGGPPGPEDHARKQAEARAWLEHQFPELRD